MCCQPLLLANAPLLQPLPEEGPFLHVKGAVVRSCRVCGPVLLPQTPGLGGLRWFSPRVSSLGGCPVALWCRRHCWLAPPPAKRPRGAAWPACWWPPGILSVRPEGLGKVPREDKARGPLVLLACSSSPLWAACAWERSTLSPLVPLCLLVLPVEGQCWAPPLQEEGAGDGVYTPCELCCGVEGCSYT